MTTTKKGGLGRRNPFTTPRSADLSTPDEQTVTAPPSVVEAQPAPKKEKSEKVRTTITMYPKTLSAMEQLRVELRKSGEKVTLSDVLDEAIWALVEKKGLSI